jgi:SAM-dependent methyltransferase
MSMGGPPAGDDAAMRARSFDGWAGEYDRFRPGYPDELFEEVQRRLELPARPLVVDVGAGTGRASLAMAGLGWRVTSVEPGRAMLEVLRARAADEGLTLSTVQASAEATGLDPQTVDLVTAAQAFHWFDADRALAEFARILRPGGGVALFWNVRDADASPFLADYAALLRRYRPDGGDMGRYETSGRDATRAAFGRAEAFAPVELVHLHQTVPMTASEFIGMAFTASYVRAALDPGQQDRFRIELAGILGRHGHDDERPFDVPYRIDLWIARRHGR